MAERRSVFQSLTFDSFASSLSLQVQLVASHSLESVCSVWTIPGIGFGAMLSSELARLVAAAIDSLDQGTLSDDLMSKLHTVLPENIILAALDIIDKENVIKYTALWGYPHYEVHGSVATYEVTLNMTVSPIPFYCSCPAFAYAVLTAGSHIMCKHVLATWLADKLSLYIERPITQNDLQMLIVRRYSNITDMEGI